MAEKLDTLLLLLGAIGILAVVAERIRFPFPILLVLAGLVIAFFPALPDVKLNPELVLMIFLPPLLHSAAWSFPWQDFRANALPILALAVGLVLMTIVCVAYASYWLIPGMTLATGYVLGAVVSPPDAVAATAVLKNLRVPKRLVSVLEGESLVNDSSGLVAYQFAIAAVMTGTFSLAKAGTQFLSMSIGGIALGLAVGFFVTHLHRQLRDPAVEITLSILSPYLAYLPAEKLGFSGVLSVVTAGLYIGHRSWEAYTPESRLQGAAIWRFLEYLLNGTVFILIGLQFPSIMEGLEHIPLWKLVLAGSSISVVVILVRFLWIFPLAAIERRILRHTNDEKKALSKGALVVASWAGMRGVVSLAAALAIPLSTVDGKEFPDRHIILFLTFFVIFVTLVLQGLSLPWLARKLNVEEPDHEYQTEGQARITLLSELVTEITRLEQHSTVAEEQESLEFWRSHYTHRLEQMQQRLHAGHERIAKAALHERRIFPQLMNHARRHLAQMRDRGEISEDLRRRIEYDFDLDERRVERILARYL
jgi:CPA1 family monovalent cation:H+ antiporter